MLSYSMSGGGTITYPQYPRTSAMGPGSSTSFVSSQNGMDIASPPQASIPAMTRRRSDYIDQSQEALMNLPSRQIDYPELVRNVNDVIYADARGVAAEAIQHAGWGSGIDVIGSTLDLAERETWACGPTELLDALEAFWTEQGLSDRLHVERFRPAALVTGDGGSIRRRT